MTPSRSLNTPVGSLTLHAQGDHITGVAWADGGDDDTAVLREACAQIEAYFERRLQAFDLPLQVAGSPAQQAICAEISRIPFGETRTYGDLAQALGLPAQAIGRGCGGNPIPLIIPCHRVLGASGLGGFSGGTGIETKVALLRHEGAAGLLI